MAFNGFNPVEILKQFSNGQKLFVFIFLVAIIALTTIVTTYLTATCSRVEEDNIVLREDIKELKADVNFLQDKNLLMLNLLNELHMNRLLDGTTTTESNRAPASLEIGVDSVSVVQKRVHSQTPTIISEEKENKILNELIDLAKSEREKN